METVEVVIRLKKERYDELQKNKHLPNRLGIEKAITDGTVLPKGHGRLIDENTIVYTDEEFADGRTYMVVHPCYIEDAPTIIKASKEETTREQEEKETFQCENCIWYDRYNHYCTTPHNMPNVILNKCPHLTTLLDAKDILSKVIEAVK